MDDESGESMEPMEEVPLIELGEAELEWSATQNETECGTHTVSINRNVCV